MTLKIQKANNSSLLQSKYGLPFRRRIARSENSPAPVSDPMCRLHADVAAAGALL
jgi:hypothetical protein